MLSLKGLLKQRSSAKVSLPGIIAKAMFSDLNKHLDYVYTRAKVFGFVMNQERFDTGFVLVFTHKI